MSRKLEIKVFGEWAYLWNKLTVVMTPKNGGPPVKRGRYLVYPAKTEGLLGHVS
jgi:hypothetical protein